MERKSENIKKIVKEGYGKIAVDGTSCCPSDPCCSGPNLAKGISKIIGYSENEMNAVPEGANLGLGCGNPVALASLKDGDVVLDLGSGAGFDAFLAAQRVGKKGRVIGVDMTPEMVAKAKENAEKGKYTNVEFRLGEIEKLPIDDNSIDVIISNCVINLSPDKEAVFKEAFRVLKSSGRLMVSDLVLIKELPGAIQESVEAYVGCLAGAIMKDQYLSCIKRAGFNEVNILQENSYPVEALANDVTAQVVKQNPNIRPEDLKSVEHAVSSIKVYALKGLKKGGCKMKIKILGTGCPKCKQLAANVEAAVKELNIPAEIGKVSDIDEITKYGVMMIPALVIDGEVKAAGEVLSPEEIKKILV